MVARWSVQYTRDKEICLEPNIELREWTAAYHWVKADKLVISKSAKKKRFFYVPAGGLLSVTSEAIKQATHCRWTSFDQFAQRAFSVWTVTMKEEDWRSAVCTCPYHLKKQKCKHVLGLAIQLKLVKPPPAAKDTPIGQKRKRGRPKKTTKALIID